MFKAACPKSYSYAYDDATSTFTCTGADYTITFCPSSTSQKSASSTAPPTTTGTTTNTTYGSIIGSSGQVPTYENSPWLPDFLTGESSRTLSSDVFHTTLLASALYQLTSEMEFLFGILPLYGEHYMLHAAEEQIV
ncbi:hypothetical protein V6N13_011700 [Hibiscus sabdariffa]